MASMHWDNKSDEVHYKLYHKRKQLHVKLQRITKKNINTLQFRELANHPNVFKI